MYNKKWYLQTWFIALIAAFSFLGFPLLIAIALVYLQHQENKEIIWHKKNFDEYLQSANEQKRSLQTQLNDIRTSLKESTSKKETLSDELANLKHELASLKQELDTVNCETIISQYNYSDYDSLTSSECKNELSMLKIKEKELIQSNNALLITSRDAKKVVNNNVKQLIRCFNSECDNIILNASSKNIDALRNKIQKSYESLNSIFSTDGVKLQPAFLELKLEELNLVYTAELKIAQEKEIQQAIKEQMKEEQKAERELEKARKELEKEQAQFSGEINKLMKYLNSTQSDVEKQLYVDKIKELEDKLRELEAQKSDIINRQQNAKAGFVYVISNIGSFGDDVYKIGMTRRLEPLDRIKELSSASVPFEFDVHAMIFSDDAPALEANLHNYFSAYKVNKVNPRKEFFRVNISEIETYVKENFNNTVTFTKLPVAAEYKQTLALLNAN